MPLLSKNLKGYVPNGHQTGIANGEYPAGVNQITEIKVIHSGIVQYGRTDGKDNPQGSTAVDKFQGKVRDTYIVNLKQKDRDHFGIADGSRGPLESLFMQLDFRPLVFGTFGECSSNVKAVIEMAVEYGMDHLGRTMAATIVDAVRMTLKRRYMAQLSMYGEGTPT